LFSFFFLGFHLQLFLLHSDQHITRDEEPIDQNYNTVDQDRGRVCEGDEHALAVKILELGIEFEICSKPLVCTLCEGDAHQQKSKQKSLNPNPPSRGQDYDSGENVEDDKSL